ncbi:adenosylcobalamin-dependent ribonucleoside-diphosphate reductase [Robertkochia sp. 1368]|nr:adenosylcobalamin-dependent ribonucleoside-diphosphate reductase [Robertkochia sediminum]
MTKNAAQILTERYLLRDQSGRIIEDADGLFRRVAHAVAQAELSNAAHWEQLFYDMMRSLLFLPNSPTLMNAGLPGGQLSACFVLPVNDSLESIFRTLGQASLIHQSGGGTGYNFSAIRPKGSMISASRGTSSGPLAFMSIYDEATRHVKQGGKRRGANMGILNIDHPDIEVFINAKLDGDRFTNFNLSVAITDAFMKAVNAGGLWELRDPNTGKVTKRLPAQMLWEMIVHAAWACGDPGLVFLDTINRKGPFEEDHPISSTNPCGEVPLENYESCNLGSVNLSKMVLQGAQDSNVDWKKLRQTVHHAIRFLDNVITVNQYPLPEVKKATLRNRKIGLGVMGWAEMLLELDVPYASQQAVALAGRLMKFIQEESYAASTTLASERGVFPSWEESRFYPDRPMRNATCNSIAPTGTIGVIADTSYAIEPLYALSFRRMGILEGKIQSVYIPLVREKLEAYGLWDDRTQRLVTERGSLSEAHWITDHIRALFKTSLEIPWEMHLAHQQAFQQYTDNAVSKTINLPENTPERVIGEIYKKAWEDQLKGITVYRDHSKSTQVLHKSCGIYPATC